MSQTKFQVPEDGPLGFGILGTGMIADFHRNAIAATPGAELRAVAHYDPAARGAELRERFGVGVLTEEELLERADIQVVSICTPSGQHAAQTVRAAEAGKHVLVEKPMALSLADADRMIGACRSNGVLLGVCLQRRTEPLFRKIRAAISGGDLGDVTLAGLTLPYFRSEEYYAQADWRGTWEHDGGGVLMNQGIHLIDLLVWFLGDPEQVTAQAATLKRSVPVEDTVAASLRFPGGTLATISGTTTAEPGFPHEIRLHGDRGTIIISGEDVSVWDIADPENAAVPPLQPGAPAAAGAAGDPRAISTAGHEQLVAEMVAAIRGTAQLSIDGEEGRRSLAAVLAIYEAAGILPRAD